MSNNMLVCLYIINNALTLTDCNWIFDAFLQ